MSLTKGKRLSDKELSEAVSRGPGWVSVFNSLTPSLSATLSNHSIHVTCPIHGGEGDFRCWESVDGRKVFDRDGFFVCSCEPRGIGPYTLLIKGGFASNFNEAYQLIADAAGIETGSKSTEPTKPKVPMISDAERQKREESKAREMAEKQKRIDRRLNQISRESFNMRDNRAGLIKTYYAKRGMPSLMTPSLRLHSGLKTQGAEGEWPCILATVTGPDAGGQKGAPETVHRTFITEQGEKALGGASKKMFSSSPPGSACRLYETALGGTLDVCEGVETGNAVHFITYGSVWACLNTAMLEKVVVSDKFTSVRIWADRDVPRNGEPHGAGMKSALRLAERLIAEGKSVEILMPDGEPDEKLDWEDVFLKFNLLTVAVEHRLEAARAVSCNQVYDLQKAS